MALTARDITMNAGAFRAAYPHWPHPEPERSVVMELWRARPGDTVTLPVFPGEVTVTDVSPGALEECAACGYQAPLSATVADTRISWGPPGRVCRDPAACCARWLDRGQAAATRYCGICRRAGDDDSRLGRDRVHNVEGAPPEGLLADVCEAAGHVFPVSDSEEEEATDG